MFKNTYLQMARYIMLRKYLFQLKEFERNFLNYFMFTFIFTLRLDTELFCKNTFWFKMICHS
jgi:hypothetical protein